MFPCTYSLHIHKRPTCSPSTIRCLYADDLIRISSSELDSSKDPSIPFEEAEDNLAAALVELGTCCDTNGLRPNPSKTQTCAFHLHNHQTNQTLNSIWQRVPNLRQLLSKISRCNVGICPHIYNPHCHKNKMKLTHPATSHLSLLTPNAGYRPPPLRRPTSTNWEAAPDVLRTTGLALYFSAGEYSCPVWHSSAVPGLDVSQNE